MARFQGINRIIVLYLCLIGVLTACGGGNTGQDDALTFISPSPTPPTSFEERGSHQLGTAENPFIMLIKPVDWLHQQIPVMLETLGLEAVTPETNLREGGVLRDDLEDLQIALDATFGVRLMTYELEAVQTAADLESFIIQRVIAETTRTIFERTSLYVDIQLIEHYGQAVNQLCHAEDEWVRMAWLDGLSYLAAAAQTCGDAGLMILRGADRDLFVDVEFDLASLDAPPTPTPSPDEDEDTPPLTIVETRFDPPALARTNLRSGVAGVLVLNGALGATNPNVLETRTLCQLDELDFYSSFLPMVILEQIDVVPANLRQMSDVETMLQAVAEGDDCTGAMVSRDDYNQYADEAWFDDIRISRTTSAFPFGILTYPLEVEVGVRLSLNEHLVALAQDATDGWYLRLLLGYDSVAEVEPSVVEDVQRFVDDLGYDFAQLGN